MNYSNRIHLIAYREHQRATKSVKDDNSRLTLGLTLKILRRELDDEAAQLDFTNQDMMERRGSFGSRLPLSNGGGFDDGSCGRTEHCEEGATTGYLKEKEMKINNGNIFN
uniref:Uncharacterized protein n=1 Tax=Cucumis sativus TaxID=3659 RepID=A0A0A0L2I5_CUCSA